GEARPGGEWQVRPYDAVAAQEVHALVEEVHRAALTLAEAVDAAEQLGHHPPRIRPLGDAVALLPVRGHRVVVSADGRGGTPRLRLLSDIEVEEAADFAEGVHLGRFLLEAPDECHLGQQPPRQLGVEPSLSEHRLGLRHSLCLLSYPLGLITLASLLI